MTVVDYWAALREGDPAAEEALRLAKAWTVDLEAAEAKALRAEVRADQLSRSITAALGALRKGNAAGAVHVLERAHDWRPDG